MTSMLWSFRREILGRVLRDFRRCTAALLLLGVAYACKAGNQDSLPAQDPPAPPVATAPRPQANQAPAAGQEPEKSILQQAAAAAAVEDFNGALNLLDRIRAESAGDPEFWLAIGAYSFALGQQRLAEGASQVAFLFADAAEAYHAAAKLDAASLPAWSGAVRAEYAQGALDAAWSAGENYRTRAGAAADPAVLVEIGRIGLGVTIAEIQAGRPAPAAARAAESALRDAIAGGDPTAAQPLSDLLAWLGRTADARETLVAALSLAPEDTALFGRLKNLGAAAPADHAVALERVRAAQPRNGTVLWYLGEAHYLAHAAARTGRDFPRAYESLDRAEESFLDAMALRPDYEESCRTWLHLVRTSRGWALREEGRVRDAAQAFVAALEADPTRLEASPDPGSLNLGIYAVVADFFREGLLADARSLLTRVTAVHDGNADWWNNLAFACRDLAVLTQEADDADAAAELFEQSWQAYGRCVALSPGDARLVNDRALISVYYLDHDHELAESELHRAIRLGVEDLAKLPEDVTEEERHRKEEAVGDAWENLAYLDVMRRGRVDRAEDYLTESVNYYPYGLRRGVQTLRREMARLRAAQAGPDDRRP